MLTQQQLATLKADILADPALNQLPNNSDGNFSIASAYNLLASPNYTVWKSTVPVNELTGQAGFDWTRVDNLTVGKARIWEFMTDVGLINPSLPNVRAGFEACFSVEVADGPTRQAIYNGSSRLATRAEKLFATGSGSPPTNHGVGPSQMGFEGSLSYQDVESARNLP